MTNYYEREQVTEKWADYLISAVRYETNSGKKFISHFKVHADIGSSVGESTTWSRIEVLEALARGLSFITILKDGIRRWEKGPQVTVAKLDGIFLRNDFKNLAEDHMTNLPEF